MGWFLENFLFLLLIGAAIGLIPFLLGRFLGKPRLGELGLICCALSGLIHVGIPVLLAIGFAAAMFIVKGDFRMGRSSGSSGGFSPTVPGGDTHSGAGGAAALSVQCLSGPLKGRVYRLDTRGITIGRSGSCGIRLPDGTPGVSRVHCCIRWKQGVPVLEDLDSAYGTFLADGRKLPPRYPVQVAAGTRFYLGSSNNLFQIIA